MHLNITKTLGQWTKLLFICLKSENDRVRSLITGVAPPDWMKDSEIQVVSLQDKFRHRTTGVFHSIDRHGSDAILGKISEIAPPAQGARIIIIGKLPIQLPFQEGDIRSVIRVNSCSELEKQIFAIVKQANCDWKSRSINALAHYHLPIGGKLVENWLSQFNKLGQLWIGEKLLQMLDIWTQSRFSNALFEHPSQEAGTTDWMSEYDIITYNDPGSGSSSAIICRLVRQCLGFGFQGRSFPLPKLLDVSPEEKQILYLEDCMMTGQECVELFTKGLLNEIASKNKLNFKFAVAATYGMARVSHFLKRNSYNNVAVVPPRAGLICNLSENALHLSRVGNLFNQYDCVPSGENVLLTGIQLRAEGVLRVDERKALTSFCRNIGRQLMAQYFQENSYSAAHASDLAGDNPFGFGNFGLMLAFSHGIPDNSIPLLRLGGDISYDGRQIKWVPLFPCDRGVVS